MIDAVECFCFEDVCVGREGYWVSTWDNILVIHNIPHVTFSSNERYLLCSWTQFHCGRLTIDRVARGLTFCWYHHTHGVTHVSNTYDLWRYGSKLNPLWLPSRLDDAWRQHFLKYALQQCTILNQFNFAQEVLMKVQFFSVATEWGMCFLFWMLFSAVYWFYNWYGSTTAFIVFKTVVP